MEIVVAHYKENLEWLNFVPDNIAVTVYSKGPEPIEGAIILPNSGRESQTYLHHIVTKYNDLHEWTVFTQGHPFDHCPDFLHKLSITPVNKKYLGQNAFFPLGSTFYHVTDKKYSDKFTEERNDLLKVLWSRMRPNVPLPKVFLSVFGAIFVVNREALHTKPISFYQELIALHEMHYVLPWTMENLWAHIFMQTHSPKACILHL